MQPDTCVSPRLLLEREPPPPAGEAPFFVHQTWKTCELPFAQAKWRERCKHILPNNTKFFVWTDAHLRELVTEEFPLHQGVYDSYDAHIKRVDASRLFVLYRYGGLYMDLDFTCIRPPQRLFVAGQVTLLPQTKAITDKEHISNAWMAAPARHPFFAHAITSLPLQAGLRHPVGATGPQFLTRVWWSWVSRVGAQQAGAQQAGQAGQARTDGDDDDAVAACHRCRSPSNWSALLASATRAATSLAACNPWHGRIADDAMGALVPPHQPRRPRPCATDDGSRRGSAFVRPTVVVYHNPVVGNKSWGRRRHGEAVVDLGSVMMRRNNNPCMHGTPTQIDRCLKNPKYPDVTFVTFWTGSWIKPTMAGWTAKNASWPSAAEKRNS